MFGSQGARWCVMIVLAMCCAAASAEVYKYRDENGKWIFTDQKPADKRSYQQLDISKTRQPQRAMPRAFAFNEGPTRVIRAENPLHIPVYMRIETGAGDAVRKVLLPPLSERSLDSVSLADTDEAAQGNQVRSVAAGQESLRYQWTFGDPTARHSETEYAFPVAQPGRYTITQGFRGRFSHSQRPNLYAVDIAMPVGTEISAARAGTVVFVKDDYAMSGQTGFFIDKANVVIVLHEDGTFASYAHILLGSARVAEGERVTQGQVLARSGSSGYSTGPHLHFVVRRNTDQGAVSLPFTLFTQNQQRLALRPGVLVVVQP